MRKNLKRVLSALLVVMMVLTMLPTAALAAGETYEVTPVTGIPASGTAMVIYNAKNNAVCGAEISGGKNTGFTAVANEENANLQVPVGTGVFKLIANGDTYYLTCGGKYYTATSTSTAEYKDEPTKGSAWKITALGSGYQIANTDYLYGSNPACLESYGSMFSPWGYDATNQDIFVMNFYAIDEKAADEDGDGFVGVKPLAGSKPADGDKVVIYNDYGQAAMGPQSDDTTAPSMNMVDATLNGSTLEVGNGALIFTVHTDGTWYTFENNGKYLRTADDECVYFDETESDYSKWRLEEITGGYAMYNKQAKYNGNAVAIEFFSNSFSGWTYNGNAGLFAMKFIPVEDELNLGYVLNPKLKISQASAQIGVDYTFTVTVDDLSEVTSLAVQYSADGGAAKTLTAVSEENKVYTYTIPSAELAGKSSLTITANATNAYEMSYSAKADVTVVDEPLIVSVMPGANEATGSNKRPEIGAVIANCGEKPTVVMTVNGESVTPTVTAGKVSYQPASSLADGKYVVALTITRADGKQTDKTWSFFVGEAGMSLYFGQFHSHTAEYSDGAGTLEDAYEHAMQAKDVDFLFVTDHSNYFDTTSTATTTSYYDLASLTTSPSDSTISKWIEAKQTAEKYNAMSDDFIAAYGYEMTWSGGPGHTNTFNTYGVVSRNNKSLNDKTNNYAGMHLYNDLMVNANRGLDVDGNPVGEGVQTKWLEDAPVVSQFNHPGTTFGNFDDFAGYTPTRDTVLNMVEVGNGEGAVGGSSYWPSYSQYDLALAKGWHVAPTNNQDNHKGKWGDANTCRGVVITDNFTEAGLYEAMAERRIYSTEDQNLAIYYYLNDTLMGGIVPLADDEELKEVHITASISDPDGEGLGKVEVIGANGISLKSIAIEGSTYELDVTLPNTDAYYYLKVTQADGDLAVTAPVWVGEATAVTCELSNSTAMSIVGQKETISTTVTNAAAMDYTINKVELSLTVGETTTVLKTIENSEVVSPEASKSYSFEFVPTVSGAQTLTVLYTGIYNGKEFKCTASLALKVYNADELVNVAVDKGHDNYYISGDYADSASNFIDFCAENGVRCNFIEAGEFTFENLKQYKMVVLTVPYRRNTAQATMYTAEEIAALKQYTEQGGNVIICSKSDRDNKFDNCADNSNALLEAIGAHSRIVDGIIVDNEMKANEAYRLYFSAKENFNTEHPFTAGAYTSSNAFGTVPATDNQTGFQVYNGGPVEVLDESKVEVLIRGYNTTWGSHYDGYFTGSSFVPVYNTADETAVSVEMGDVNVMTYEDLPGGGWVITSGVTFFSNYDIKGDVDYANKFILKNILDSLTDTTSVTPISKVHKGAEKEEYTIEGIVTANASGYDQDTAFFDCIYVQDETRGINLFPVAGNYAVGMKVRAHGGVTYYCGEIELNLSPDYNGSIKIISDDIAPLEPTLVTAATAMADSSIGNLMKVQGIVTEVHKTAGVIDKIYVRDATGTACLFINGYIMKDYTGIDGLKPGMMVSGIGIGSRDVDETSADNRIFARLRVRDRSEIQILDETINVTALFSDVQKGVWYVEPIQFVVGEGLFNGFEDGTFRPNDTLTRAMAATVLYRLSGENGYTTKANFPDVLDGVWYTDAVSWAQENGIVKGYEDGTFRPDGKITRQEMTVMLQRYAEKIGKTETPANGDLNQFPDAASVAPWAKDAMSWCVGAGIINGKDGKIQPMGDATRAEFAAILMRYVNLVK